MKTYFKYEGLIKSKEAAEAIAAPVALGPFCGFGSVKVSGNKLSVQAMSSIAEYRTSSTARLRR